MRQTHTNRLHDAQQVDFSTLPPAVVGMIASFLCYIEFRTLEVAGVKLPESHWSGFGRQLLTQFGSTPPDPLDPFIAKVACRRLMHMRWLASTWEGLQVRNNEIVSYPMTLCTLQAIKDAPSSEFFIKFTMLGRSFEGLIGMSHRFVPNYLIGAAGPRNAAMMIGEIDFQVDTAPLAGVYVVPSKLTVLCLLQRYLLFPGLVPSTNGPGLVYMSEGDRHDVNEITGHLEPHLVHALGRVAFDITHSVIFSFRPVDLVDTPFRQFCGVASATAYIRSTGKILIEIMFHM